METSLFMRMKAHRWYFLVGIPACFVLLSASTFLFPKTYKSSFVVVAETEQASETNRTLTLNQPSSYDLGLVRTDNAVNANGYVEVLKSDSFLYGLLETHVRTLDGSYEGPFSEYLLHHQKQLLKLGSEKEPEALPSDTCSGWYSRRDADLIRSLRGAVRAKLDYETRFVTISCTAQDPMVATLLARAVQKRLLEVVDAYEFKKMKATAAHLRQLAEQSEGSSKEAFERQLVVYEAQMVHQPAFLTLSEPTVDYRKVAPSRWKIPMALTFLYVIGLLLWLLRPEIKRYIQG